MSGSKSTKLQKSQKSASVRRLSTKRQRRLLTHSRVMRYGVRNFTRNAWLTVAATAVMTITLLIIFATVLISQMLSGTVLSLREKIDISVYFKPSTSDDTLRNLKGKMQLVENVREVTVSSSENEYNNYIDSIQNDPAKLQAISILPQSGVNPADSFSAVMHIKVNDLNNLQPIKETVAKDPQFQQYLDQDRSPSYAGDQQDTINRIASWASFAQRAGLIAGIIFLVISILVIFNTIRMAIFSRRDEIDMMKSVGADRYFIRGPFLIEAEMYGVFAALIATALGYLAFIWISPALSGYGIMVGDVHTLLIDWCGFIVIAMIALGIIIGYVSARLAVRRYLK